LKTEQLSTIKVQYQAHYGDKVPFLEDIHEYINDLALPKTVDDLLELLNKTYPEQSASIEDNAKEIYFKAGQRDVVRFINVLKKRSED